MTIRVSSLAAALAALALPLTACGSTPRARGLHVVGAENFWGSIAAQLGGSDASTRSIIVNPAQDPHDYEPTAADARTLALAKLVIVNGVGYDPWVPRLLAANPVPGRIVLTVGDLLGLPAGANPHRWYDPADVEAVASAITRDLQRLDPANAGRYRRLYEQFESQALAAYHRLIATIRERYGGTPVGASESIFAPLAPSLGLRLLTPPNLMKAVSEGSDISAQDLLSAQRQIIGRQIKVWVFNSQNNTPAIQRLTDLARAHGIPVTSLTETLVPEHASFQQWQVAELQALARALHEATGR